MSGREMVPDDYRRESQPEAITLVHDGQVSDEVYDEAATRFDQPELAALVCAIVTINAWNRIAITSRAMPESYEPEEAR